MKWKNKLFLLTLIAIKLVDEPAPEVTIAQGTLIGKISSDGTFFEYLGIPYATTNSSTRFRAPGPPPSWTGLFKAVEESSSCPQNSFFGVIGNEDCLKINVFVPALNKKSLPVLVYIHGGAFIFGSGGKSLYGPDFLVQKGVIVVTFNYRLGLLGFLCLRIKEAPGNAGIKDQLAALRWVKKNIGAFGGDSNNITIMGESAGATSASLLLISDAAAGLFNRAIMQSAGDTNETLAERHGRYLFASDLRFSSDEEGFVISKKVENFYFGDDIINMSQILKVAEFYTQLYFEIPAIFETECLIDKTQSKVYNYIFNYSGQRNFMKLRSGYYNEPGASHADDLFYLFRGSLIPPIFTKQDKKIIDYMTTLWTNFAKYGDPTPDWTNSVLKWEPSKKHNMKFLYIDDVPKIGSMPNNDAFHLWKNIYDKYRKTDI
ncbi:juvenile hormone esterase-like isoform X4 [Danaus plexippus]|uniref:juvenile hormone esterase-like isoform X4 n=1 Tax=Danaus plexippus TaxID=13037 RepID=UPI002AB1222F|nr:juvenile hormone esterase-like isoform X4 [Danaus plexippus]